VSFGMLLDFGLDNMDDIDAEGQDMGVFAL
jgi:hypothetical protein